MELRLPVVEATAASVPCMPIMKTLFTAKYISGVYTLLKALKANRVSHGDLKMPNIIITDSGPTLIDIDQVRFHRSKYIFARRRLRDLRRFRQDFPWNRAE